METGGGRARIAACLLASCASICAVPSAQAKTFEIDGCRYEAGTAAEPTAIAKATIATSTNPPAMRLDGGPWLEEANYNQTPNSVRPNVLERDPFQVDQDAYQSAVWMAATDRSDGGRTGMAVLAKLMLMKAIESMPSLALDACSEIKQDAAFKAQLQELRDRAARFQLEVYQDPARSEFVKRVQASRATLFDLARKARRGDAAADRDLRKLAAMAAADPMSGTAVTLFEAFDAPRPIAYARAKAGNREAAYAYASLQMSTYSLQDERELTQRLHANESMQILGEARGFLAVWEVAAGAMRLATDQELEANGACGVADSTMPLNRVIAIQSCRSDKYDEMKRRGARP